MTTNDTTEDRKKPTAKPVSRRQPMSRLLPEGSPGAVARWVPTQWPRPGGKKLVPLPDDAFLSEAFTSAYPTLSKRSGNSRLDSDRLYDARVAEIAVDLKSSARGELKTTDVNRPIWSAASCRSRPWPRLRLA